MPDRLYIPFSKKIYNSNMDFQTTQVPRREATEEPDIHAATILDIPHAILERHVVGSLLRERSFTSAMNFLKCCKRTWTSEILAGTLKRRVVRAHPREGTEKWKEKDTDEGSCV